MQMIHPRIDRRVVLNSRDDLLRKAKKLLKAEPSAVLLVSCGGVKRQCRSVSQVRRFLRRYPEAAASVAKAA